MGSRSGYNWTWKVDRVYTFDEMNTPKELIEFRDKWRRIFSKSSLVPNYPEKSAGFVFEYKGRAYEVSAGDFGETSSVFAKLSRQIENELVEIGAEKVFYTGMLD